MTPARFARRPARLVGRPGAPADATFAAASAAVLAALLLAGDVGAASRLVAHVPTGPQPTTVNLIDGGRLLAVANRGDESLWIFDGVTLEVVGKHSVVGRHGIWDAEPVGPDRVLVSHWKGETVSLLDLQTGEFRLSMPVGIKPSYVALSPDGAMAFVAGQLSGDVALLDLEKGDLIRILEVGDKPMGVAVSPDGAFLYVASSRSRKISRVALKHQVVLDHFGAPLAETTNLAVTPDGRMVLAAGDDHRLLLIDAETGRVDKVKVPAGPAGVAVSPDGRLAFVACYEAALVAVVDLGRRSVIEELAVGPGCLDVATDGRRVYAVNDQAASMSVYELGEVAAIELPAAIEVPAATPPAESSPLGGE